MKKLTPVEAAFAAAAATMKQVEAGQTPTLPAFVTKTKTVARHGGSAGRRHAKSGRVVGQPVRF